MAVLVKVTRVCSITEHLQSLKAWLVMHLTCWSMYSSPDEALLVTKTEVHCSTRKSCRVFHAWLRL